jgi:drug/metabolite transporter (DMT)-like permease
MASHPSRSLTAVSAAITIVFWGSAFAAIRVGLHSYSPTHLALFRFLSASAALGVYAIVTRMPLPRLRDVPLVFLLGFIGITVYHVALNIGEQTVASGPAAVIIQTSPIWTAMGAMLFLGESLGPWGWVGIGVSFAGAIVIGLGSGSGMSLGWGAALVMLAALSMSAYNLVQKKMLSRCRPVELTTYAIWAGTLLMLPFCGGLVPTIRSAPIGDTAAVLFLGVFPAALAYVTWSIVLNALPASRASSLLFMVPVVAFLVGWVWLGETPTLVDLAGGVLAMGGVMIVNTLGRSVRRPPGP